MTLPVRTATLLLLGFLLGVDSAAYPQQARPAQGRVFTLEGGARTWQPLTLTFATRLDLDESAHPPGANPFLDYRLNVTFRHPASKMVLVVPGFFAADGDAADTSATAGNRWRARFLPDQSGTWTWRAEFRHAAGIALDSAASGTSADPAVDGAFGVFQVGPTDPAAPGFEHTGRLEYAGERYFRFAETGAPYLKSGAGGPENFLAYYELDGTSGDPGSLCLNAPANPDHLHHFEPHAGDFLGDALDLGHLWAGGRGVNVLGALDYLASVGVNSLYFLTDTYRGDGKDVWPWTQPTDKLHFDVSKLEQWERIFTHMSQRGIQLQVVLEEAENDQLALFNGGLGYGLTNERRLYYREMIARFAHHPAVIWIVGDESNYYDEIPVMESLAGELRALDPYDHPLAFHGKHPCTGGGCPQQVPSVIAQYSPYFDFAGFEASAYQTAPGAYNSSTLQLVGGQLNGRKWAHYGDEQSLNAIPSNRAENRKKALWGNLMAGGAGIAWYPGNAASSQYPGVSLCDYFDLSNEDLRLFDAYFRETEIAVELFQSELPFREMQANNALAAPSGPQDYVFYRPENAGLGVRAIYAVYRSAGSATDLTLGDGPHSVEWFNPRTGAGPIAADAISGPGPVTLPPPIEDPGQDWVAIVRQQ
jgi:hypothetical protein